MRPKIIALDGLPTRRACGLLGFVTERDPENFEVVRAHTREVVRREVVEDLVRDERLFFLPTPLDRADEYDYVLYATKAFIIGPAERFALSVDGLAWDSVHELYLLPCNRERGIQRFAQWARQALRQCRVELESRARTAEHAGRIKDLAERARFATAVAEDKQLRIENYAWLLLARALLGVDDSPVRDSLGTERSFSDQDRRAVEEKLAELRLVRPSANKRSDRELPTRGDVVLARARRWLVEDIAMPAPGKQELTKLTLACLDDDARGTTLEVLFEREPDLKVLDAQRWSDVASRGFDSPARFAAYLDAQRWNSVTATDPNRLQAPFRAAIRVEAYQLEPLMKALALPRVNLFIADDVGLGKTIEAGLVLRELLLRQKARRVLVACPPSVSLQWKDELERRFGLSFEVFDRDFVRRARRQRGQGVNPWTTHRHFILSHALLRVEEYAAPLRDWLDDKSAGPALLILDEAHHVAPASIGNYGVDSQLTRAMRALAPKFHHRLFLSATPHNGLTNSFTALLEILDPMRFTRGDTSPTVEQLRPVMIRRLKTDFANGEFAERVVEQINIKGLPEDAPELVLSKLLQEYRELRRQLCKSDTKHEQRIAELVTTALHKRLLSSIEAFASTLEVHRQAVEEWLDGKSRRVAESEIDELADELDAPDNDDERAEWSREDRDAGWKDAVDKGTTAARAPKSKEDVARVRALLGQMQRIAEKHRGAIDPKLRKLIDWINAELIDPETRQWKNRRVVVFTEYTSTLDYIARALEKLDRKGDRVAIFDGGMSEEQRERLKAQFNADPATEPLRILLATDAAREGVNLQNHCYDLFHFDIPWNPSRMEQRNGRIDRKLQRNKQVFCRYFVFDQRTEDRVLETLVRRTETIRRELGAIPPVLDSRLVGVLRGSFSTNRDVAKLVGDVFDEQQKRANKDSIEEVRETKSALEERLDTLRDRLEESRKSVGFDPEALRFAVNEALAITNQPPLESLAKRSGDAELFKFPAVDAHDPSWAPAMDTLRPAKTPDESLAQWRREPPRPVTFEDVGTIDRDTVHLHLEHRVVRRLLDRFTAQGFTHHDMSRATVMATRSATPKVLMFARVVLYGQHGERLHDEIQSIASRWHHPDQRAKSPLAAYKDTQHRETLQELADAMKRRDRKALNGKVGGTFLASVSQDIEALFGILMARVAGVQETAVQKLARRGDEEARRLTKLLIDQEAFIRKQIDKASAEHKDNFKQLELQGMSVDEIQQRAEDLRHWEKRLKEIAVERAEEPAKLAAAYEVRARHVEPVGIVYLWPETG